MTTSFRSTLRRLADEADPIERTRLSELFASQIELAIDHQGDNMAMALWAVEEQFGTKIDHLQEQVGNANLLQSKVLEAIGALRGDVQASAVEISARLGKSEDDIGLLQVVQAEHAVRLDELDNLQVWRAGVDTRIAAIEQADRDDVRAEIIHIKALLERYESELRMLVERLGQRTDEQARHAD